VPLIITTLPHVFTDRISTNGRVVVSSLHFLCHPCLIPHSPIGLTHDCERANVGLHHQCKHSRTSRRAWRPMFNRRSKNVSPAGSGEASVMDDLGSNARPVGGTKAYALMQHPTTTVLYIRSLFSRNPSSTALKPSIGWVHLSPASCLPMCDGRLLT
jgi:hypothetical protein